jgi:hypothetical protein
VRLWDLSVKNPAASPLVLPGGEPGVAMLNHLGKINAVAISPDNHWLVTCGRDYTVAAAGFNESRGPARGRSVPVLGGRQGSAPIRRYLLALLPEGTGFASVPIASVAGGKPGDPSRKLMHRLRPSPTEMLKQTLT